MKFWMIIDKLFMFLGFVSAAISAVFAFIKGESYVWQLACMAWICIAYIKQLSIESYDEEE